jgi:Fe-S cluster biogenesis protein NfuA
LIYLFEELGYNRRTLEHSPRATVAAMFIPFQSTPNPDALKFLPPARLTLGEVIAVERDASALPPLATALFQIEAVLRVMIGPDFVTVTRRTAGERWPALKPEVLARLATFFLDGPSPWDSANTDRGPTDEQVESEIRQVIALHVRPGAQRDGGDITVERFDPPSGVLFVRMEGACNGCPSSQLTLRASVEQIVRRYVPEVLKVEHSASPSGPKREPAWRRLLDRAAVGASHVRTVFSHNGVARSEWAD